MKIIFPRALNLILLYIMEKRSTHIDLFDAVLLKYLSFQVCLYWLIVDLVIVPIDLHRNWEKAGDFMN